MGMIRQVGSLAGANAIYLLSQLGVLSLLTYFTDVETVAAFGYAMAIIQPLFQLALLGLRSNLATDARGEHGFATFLSARLFMTAALIVSVLGFFALFKAEYWLMALPLVLQKATELQANLCYGAMQRAGRIELIARSLMTRGPITLLLFGVVLYMTRSANIALWAQTAVWGAVLLFYDYPRTRAVGEVLAFDRNLGRIWRLMVLSAPLGVGSFMSVAQVSVPRLVVEATMDDFALALLTVVGYLQRSAIVLVQSVDQAIGWRLSRLWANGQTARFHVLLYRMMGVAVALGAAGCLFSWLVGAQALALGFGPAYAAGGPLLQWITLAVGFRLIASVLQTGLIAQRRFMDFGAVQFAMLVLTVPATLIGVKMGGLIGIGISIAALALLRVLIELAILKLRRAPAPTPTPATEADGGPAAPPSGDGI